MNFKSPAFRSSYILPTFLYSFNAISHKPLHRDIKIHYFLNDSIKYKYKTCKTSKNYRSKYKPFLMLRIWFEYDCNKYVLNFIKIRFEMAILSSAKCYSLGHLLSSKLIIPFPFKGCFYS